MNQTGGWDVPDLALIFRTPANVMNNFEVAVRPQGQWGGFGGQEEVRGKQVHTAMNPRP